MKQGTPWWVRNALKHIREMYSILFEKGYEFFSAEPIDLGRQVTLRKQDLFVRIEESRGEEEIYFKMGTPIPDEFTDIGTVIYAATGDKIPRWESSNPKVLAQYLDRIETYFAGEYVQNKDSLQAAQKEYVEAFWPGGVGVLPEPEILPSKPKIIPILHYPLMGMILLLLFGALTTLYMVLLDRLFSAFSLDADTYGILMGVVSLLFAVGTMLLFWRQRKKG
jgi:hypothetical protein